MRNWAARRFKSTSGLSREVIGSKPLECFGTAFLYPFFSQSVCLETVSPFEQYKPSGLAVQPDANTLDGSSWIPRFAILMSVR